MSHPVIECRICGASFTVRPYRVSTARTCSAACRQKYNGQQQTGDAMRFRGEGKSYVKLGGRHMHRVIAERKLGRPLLRGEVVHHLDGNKRNNAPENLEILPSQSAHIAQHREALVLSRRVERAPCKCGGRYHAKGMCQRCYLKNYNQCRLS